MILVRAYSSIDILASSTVEDFLREAGYSDMTIRTLKRPFREVVKLPDGMLIRQKFKLNAWANGFLYVLLRNGDSFSEFVDFKTLFKLGLLTRTMCVINKPEV